MLISCFQIGSFSPARFIYTAGPAVPAEGESSGETPPPAAPRAPRSGSEGNRSPDEHPDLSDLDAEKLVSTTGKTVSNLEIVKRLRTIAEIREKDSEKLRGKLEEWYGGRGEEWNTLIKNGDIEGIRAKELERLKAQVSDSTARQLEDIFTKDQDHGPAFQDALNYLAEAGIQGVLSPEAKKIVASVRAGESSATRYLKEYRKLKDLEHELHEKQQDEELNKLKEQLKKHEDSIGKIQEKKEAWDAKKWRWLPKFIAKPLMVLGGLESVGFGIHKTAQAFLAKTTEGVTAATWGNIGLEALKGFFNIPIAAFNLASVSWGGPLTYMAGAALAFHLTGIPRKWGREVSHRWGKGSLEKSIKQREEALGIPGLQENITASKGVLEKEKQENQHAHETLKKQAKALEDWTRDLDAMIKNKPDTAAENRLNKKAAKQGIHALEAIAEPFKVSEEGQAERFRSPGAVTNEYIYGNIRAMKLRDPKLEAEIEALTKSEDQGIIEVQKTMKKSPPDLTQIHEELNGFTDEEKKKLKEFFEYSSEKGKREWGEQKLKDSIFERKAPHLYQAVYSIFKFGGIDTAFRIRTANAILKVIDGLKKNVTPPEPDPERILKLARHRETESRLQREILQSQELIQRLKVEKSAAATSKERATVILDEIRIIMENKSSLEKSVDQLEAEIARLTS